MQCYCKELRNTGVSTASPEGVLWDQTVAMIMSASSIPSFPSFPLTVIRKMTITHAINSSEKLTPSITGALVGICLATGPLSVLLVDIGFEFDSGSGTRIDLVRELAFLHFLTATPFFFSGPWSFH